MFLTLEEGIQALRKHILDEVPLERELYVPAQGTYSTTLDEKPFDLSVAITQFLFPEQQESKEGTESQFEVTAVAPTVLLLLGEAGSGKSMFCYDLVTQLWQKYQEGAPIPLFINLPRLVDPVTRVIEETLENYGFNASQIAQLKKERRFIFILDAYDEIHQLKNLYVSNHLETWQAKIIITCRSQSLHDVADADKYFMPFHHEKRQPGLLRRCYVAPFSEQQTEAYLKQYARVHAKEKDTSPVTYEQLCSIPGLKELITMPFLLHLAVEVLPDILIEHSAVKSFTERDIKEAKEEKALSAERMTQAKLYDSFVERWFKRQENKLKMAGQLEDSQRDIKPTFWQFCKALAQTMRDQGVTWANYQAISSSTLFTKTAVITPESPWKRFFSKDPQTELIRSACPLKKLGPNQYGFIHASLIEYFATRQMYDELTQATSTKEEKSQAVETASSLPTPQGHIYQKIFTKDRNAIGFLADRVEQSEAFKTKLFEIIESSKKDEQCAVGAANAISALARASVSFAGLDWRGIRIRQADVSYAIFDYTQLQGADLREVLFQGCWLRNTHFQGANMEGVQLAELPSFILPDKATACLYSPDGRWLAAGSGKNIFLYDAATRKLAHVFEGHTDSTRDLAFSPDSLQLASGSEDKTVRLWDITTRKHAYTFEGYAGRILCIAFNVTGTLLATAGDKERDIRLWDVKARKLISMISEHKEEVRAIAFSPDGMLWASASDSLELWDAHTQKLLGIFKNPNDFPTIFLSVVFSSDSGRLASAEFHTIRLWDVISRNCTHIFQQAHYPQRFAGFDYFGNVSFSPDNSWLLSCTEGTIQLWDIAKRKLEYIFEGHSGDIRNVQFHPSGQWIISAGGGDKTVRLWNLTKEKYVPAVKGHTDEIYAVALCLDGRWLASTGRDKVVLLWDLKSGNLRSTLKGQNSFGKSVTFSRDSLQLMLASGENIIRAWNTINYEIVRTFEDGYSAVDTVNAVSFSPNNTTLAAPNYDKTIRLWDITTGEITYTFKGHTDWVNCVDYSPDGLMLASAGQDNTMRLWDIADKKMIREFKSEGPFHEVIFSPNGRWLASRGNLDRSDEVIVCLWNVAHQKLEYVVKVDERKNFTAGSGCLAFSPDSTKLASGNNEKTISLWDVSSKKLLHTFEGHTGRVSSIVFHPNGLILASGSADNTMRLWDISQSKELFCVKEFTNSIGKINFDAKGEYLFIGSGKSIHRWHMASRKLEFCFDVTSDYYKFSFNLKIGKLACTGEYGKGITLFNVADGKLECHLKRGEVLASVDSIAISPDGRKLISGCEDKVVRLWDLTTDKLEYVFAGHTGKVNSVAFSPTGLKIISGAEDKTIRLWNVSSYKLERVFEGHASDVRTVAFAPHGFKFVSSGGYEYPWYPIKLWDSETGKHEYSFTGHQERIHSLAFSPDGLFLASASGDGTVRLWRLTATLLTQSAQSKEPASMESCSAIIKGFTSAVTSVAWQQTLGGLLLATASKDRAVRCWQVSEDKHLNTVVKLRWSSRQTALTAPDANIEGAIGLDVVNRDLLQERGAIVGKAVLLQQKEQKEQADLEELHQRAMAGNPAAQYELAKIYDEGKGVKQDDSKAFEWYEKAAQGGDAWSQRRVAAYYEEGRVVKQDDTKAFEWNQKSANQGNVYAQARLGHYYAKGRGVKQDNPKAAEWYEKAAQQGFAEAQLQVAVHYECGWGVSKDEAKAFGWYEKAALQGEARAQWSLAVCYANGRGVKQDDSKAFIWYEKAAQQGLVLVQRILGDCYAKGKGVKQDDAKAFEWYEKAALQGDSAAQNKLGECYAEGKGVKQDYSMAIEWCEKAVQQGNTYAQGYLDEIRQRQQTASNRAEEKKAVSLGSASNALQQHGMFATSTPIPTSTALQTPTACCVIL